MLRRYSISIFAFIFALVAIVLACFALENARAAATPPSQIGDTEGVATLRQKLRQPLSPRDVEALLQPKKLTSIGEIVKIDGQDALPCIGVGLVTGLAGNGAEKPGSMKPVKDEVIKALVREEGKTVAESLTLVESRDSSIVYVSGQIPAGAAPQNTFDVTLEPIDSAISLQGGYLHLCPLYKYIQQDNKKVRGGIIARAGGQVMASVVQDTVIATAASQRTAMVFDGAVYMEERDLLIRLDPKLTSVRTTVLIEYMLNRRFRDVGRQPGTPGVNYATAVTNSEVVMRIPPLYRRHVTRLADVIGSLRGSYFYGPPSEGEMKKIAKRLESGTSQEKYQASATFEGIGSPSTPYLLNAVAKGDDWARLYAGTALAYLNDPQAGEAITKSADSQIEDVRLEAVRLLAQMSGAKATEVLRAKIADPSRRIATEAIKGLVSQGGDAAQMARFSYFDFVAVRGGKPGITVVSSGRPIVAMEGPVTPLVGNVEVRANSLGIGSIDDKQVGVVSGEGPRAETVTVDKTVDGVLTAVARTNPPFDVVKQVLATMETNKNLPYKIAWLD
jgi:hypothetical protein